MVPFVRFYIMYYFVEVAPRRQGEVLGWAWTCVNYYWMYMLLHAGFITPATML